MRGRRGITVGVVMAVVVLTAVAVIGIYQIMRTYTVSYRALAEYSVQVQKPVFRLAAVSLNGTNVTFTLVNEGPVGARVDRVHLFVYDQSTGVPASTDAFPYNKYVSVGGRVEIQVPVSNINRYMAQNKPVRFAVETDKGPVLVGADPLRGTLRINMILPQHGQSGDVVFSNNILHITCPAVTSTPWQTYFNYRFSVPAPPGSYPEGTTFYVDPSNKFSSVSVEIPAIAPCMITLQSTIQRVRIIGPYTSLAQLQTAEQANFLIDNRTRTITLRAIADIKPGGVANVEFNLPEIIAERIDITPPTGTQASVIDFSWYYFGHETENPAEETHFRLNMQTYELTARILASGAIQVTSPSGCMIYPPASNNPGSPPGLISAWDWYEYTPTETNEYVVPIGPIIMIFRHAYHTGPTIVTTPSSCMSLSNGAVMMRVIVPFRLSQGRYLIVPVMTYDDKDSYPTYTPPFIIPNALRVSFRLAVEGPGGTFTQFDEPDAMGPVQIAYPFVINAGGGDYRVVLDVIYRDGTADWLRVIVSKVVIIPILGSPLMCTFDAPSEPMYPFATINMQTGSVTRNGVIYAKIGIRTKDTYDPNEARQIMDRLLFTYFTENYYRVATASITGVAGSCQVSIGGNTVPYQIRSPMFCGSGTSISLSLDIAGMSSPNYVIAGFVPYLDATTPPETLPLHTFVYGVSAYGFHQNEINILAYDILGGHEHVSLDRVPMSVFFVRYTYVWQTTPTLVVSINTGSSGNWLVLIPFEIRAYWKRFANEPSVNTGTIIYSIYTENVYIGVVAVRFTGSSVTIRLTLPRLVTPDYGYVTAVFNNILVAPEFTGVVVANTPLYTFPQLSTTAGILLNNLRVGDTQLAFRLVRKSDNMLAGYWTYSASVGQTMNILLPVTGLFRNPNTEVWVRRLVEMWSPDDYVLIVFGAQC